MIVLVRTVERIVKEYQVELPDGTVPETIYSKVDETEEDRSGWIECDYSGIENLTEITTTDGQVLWMLR